MKKQPWGEILRHAILMSLVGLTLFPLYFLIITSFKDYDQFIHHFWEPTLPLRFENYVDAWLEVRGYIGNSLLYASIVVFFVVLLSTISAYVFARHKFPGKELLFYLIIGVLMIPPVLMLIPQFLMVRLFGLLDTRAGLVLPMIAGGQVFSIFILRTFFAGLPEELFEAARIDGANHFQLYSQIAIPLSFPIIVTIAMLNFVGTWNEIIWPLIVLSRDELRPVTTGLLAFQGQFSITSYGPMFAGYVLASVPLVVVFLFCMKYYIRGITSGALKI